MAIPEKLNPQAKFIVKAGLLPFDSYISNIIIHSGYVKEGLDQYDADSWDVVLNLLVNSFPPELLHRYKSVSINLNRVVQKEDVQKLKSALEKGTFQEAAHDDNTLMLERYFLDDVSPVVTFLLPTKETLIKIQAENESTSANFNQNVDNFLTRKLNAAPLQVIYGRTRNCYIYPGGVAIRVYNYSIDPDLARANRDHEIEILQKLEGGPFPRFLPELAEKLSHESPYITIPTTASDGQSLGEIMSQYAKVDRLSKLILKFFTRNPSEYVVRNILKSIDAAREFAAGRNIALGDIANLDNWVGLWSDYSTFSLPTFSSQFVDMGSAVVLTEEARASDAMNRLLLEQNLKQKTQDLFI